MIKKALLCDIVASYDLYRSTVARSLEALDGPHAVTGLTGTRRMVDEVKSELVTMVLHDRVDSGTLVRCAIELLTAAYVLRNGRP